MKKITINLTENAHPHAEMMIAKAADMSLIAFVNLDNKWYRATVPAWTKEEEYFLCLPKHKDACLHWLNGGEVQCESELIPLFQHYNPNMKWYSASVWMQEDFEFRIKPKKQKRWVRVRGDGISLDTMILFTKKNYAVGDGSYQVFEIEVEVTQ